MGNAIQKRGPDSHGEWSDGINIGLSHRRLSIFDLSSAGHQPMISPNQRFILAFNGEIYNFLELKKFIEEKYSYNSWNGSSDTEVLLTSMEFIGVEATLKKCIGMFAFALWDQKEKKLILGRDRLGEKPLYYGWNNHEKGKTFIFGSDLNALKVHPNFNKELNLNALDLYMSHSYVPSPFSIYKNTSKLNPGCIATISLDENEINIKKYWSASDVFLNGASNSFKCKEEEIINNLENKLIDSIKIQMHADVPIGAFLSGGIDSSTVVALMQSQASRPVQTFSIGFEDGDYNEAEYAKKISNHLNTNHTELYVSGADSLSVIPKLANIYSEPFADSSQIPTYLVSKLARDKVTVSLSGDGGDELFGGYNRYILIQSMWKYISLIPRPMRLAVSKIFLKIKPNYWNSFFKLIQPVIPGSIRQNNWGNKIQKTLQVIALKEIEDIYLALVSSGVEKTNLVKNLDNSSKSIFFEDSKILNKLTDIEKMMSLDILNYLPDDILTKVDRSTMAVSLEARVPFLDHRVVEFASKIPINIKIKDGIGKWPLREVLYRHVPAKLIERPKMGFSIPLSEWLKDSLKGWAEKLIDESRLKKEGYLCHKLVNQYWSEHQSGSHDRSQILWNILMFQAWLDENK